MKHSRVLVAAAAAALVIGVVPAFATGNMHHVFNGTNGTTMSHPTSLTASPATVGPATCPSLTLTGAWQGGPGQVDLLTISTAKAVACTGFLPSPGFAVTGGTMKFHSTGAATAGATDLIVGHVHDVSVWVESAAHPAICAYSVTGIAAATFDESTQVLTINEPSSSGNLVLANVAGCLGQIQDGNPAGFTGSFAQPNINIQ